MYQTRRIDEKSYSSIKELYLKAFGIREPLSSIERKYDTACFGLKNIGIIAETGGREPAAYYGVFPIVLQYESSDYLIAQSGDTMTAPDHRNKGLFVQLARETYQLAEKEGVMLIYGFPNKNSFPGFQKKLNWIFNGAMQKFTVAGFGFPFCELAHKWRFLQPMYKKYVENRLSVHKIDANELNIETFTVKAMPGHIKKDLNYFGYKLRNPDNYLIRFREFTLLIKPRGNLIIGAVGYFEENKINEFIKAIKELSGKLACRKAVIALSDNHWLYSYLAKTIHPEVSLPIGYYQFNDHFDVRKIEFIQADYDTF